MLADPSRLNPGDASRTLVVLDPLMMHDEVNEGGHQDPRWPASQPMALPCDTVLWPQAC